MKKIRQVLTIILTGIILVSTMYSPVFGADNTTDAPSAIIADHGNATLADFEAIPMEWINKAKTDLHIYYNHTSHGSQIPDGMTGLAGFKGSTYSWNTSGSNGSLHLIDTYNTDLGNSNWHGITRSYLDAHAEINVVMWSWCGQVSGATETYINNYLSAMNQLEQDYPNVQFIYMTGHTDGSGVNGNLHIRNEQIRQYCRTNNRILFDFADIESYDPDGNYYLNKAVNDECKYDSDGNGSIESNWATAWQNTHTQNAEWYSCGSAHSQPLNANMKAYAAWYLWARIAGWDGVSDGTPGGGGTPANNAPVLESIGARSVTEGSALVFTVNAIDPDATDTLTYSVNTTPAGSLPEGSGFNEGTKTFTWTPNYTQNGIYTLRFTVSDGALSNYEDVTITVNEYNDTTAPSVPTDLTGVAASQTTINLNWTASTDNIGEIGYRIYRNGTQIGTSATNSYSDIGLTEGSPYAYRVSAYDAADNESAQCTAVEITLTTQPSTQPSTQSSTQVSQLAARHYGGQTLLTWNEIPEVAAAVSNTMTVKQIKDTRASLNQITYRIYRSTSPITSVAGLTPTKTIGVLTGWDDEFYGRENSNINNQPCPRFVVEKDTNDAATAPVPTNTAVSAYNPSHAGTAWYAVTAVRNGVEETATGPGNTVSVTETVGQGIPILQKIETVTDYFYTDGDSTHYYYTRWESPPNSNVQGRPSDYKVIVPQAYHSGTPAPVNMSFHGWGSSMLGNSGWWYNFDKGTISITTNQFPYDWWTGYHEKYGIGERSQQNWASGVVHPYTQNRLNSFYDWAASKWSLDQSRTLAAGVSMGGSGSIMYGIRNPDRVAWVNSWVGVHVPAESPTFKSSYQGVYGQVEWQIKYEDGVTPAFSFFDDDWYLRNHISEETPFITFSNGRNDSGIGWSQAVKFANALQDTKRPHIFYWGMGGHNQRTMNPPDINGNRSQQENPIDIRTDQSLPAFTNCSLDDDLGNGNTDNGDESGQINAYMFWKTEDIVDTQQRWEMTVGVVQTAPSQSCTVSLTPRRLQSFQTAPGSLYQWTNTSLSNNTLVQSGTITCDGNGLITLHDLTVNRITQNGGGNRIVIQPAAGGSPQNHPPVLAAVGARTVNAGETLSVTVEVNDPDIADDITCSASAHPSGSLPQGAAFNATTRTFSWTPQNHQAGVYSIVFSASDGQTADSETITITVASTANNPSTPSSGSINTFEDGKTPINIIHVATSGNDSTGSGSAASPFRSIARAAQAAAPGTAVRIHPGTYSARVNINGLSGTAQAPIWIGGAPGEAKPVITSSSEGIHLTKVRYLILHDLEIANTPENAINCDDGGEYANMEATRHAVFRNLYIHDIGTSGNEDGLKLSGVNDYYILDCEITNCGNDYGSGIDHVGCHNGVIANNDLHDFSGNAIQCKGGSENIEIRGNRLVDCGERAVNIGGSSDLAVFRPPLSTMQPNYEAKNIRVYGNLMRGTIAPLAFVGATNCIAANNTILSPENWIIRFLQERTTSAPYTFGPCGNNTVANNIFYYDGSALSQYGAINVGNNTSPSTFTFSNNLWYNYNSAQHSTPNLPVTETNGIYGQDPLFSDPANDNVSLHTSSPALERGTTLASVLFDYNGNPFGNPRNIGALAGSSSVVQNQPPVLSVIGTKTISSGSTLSFTANGDDPDASDTLVYAVSGVSPVALPNGISINAANGAFSWTPAQNQCGTFTVRITVSDGELSDSENVVITVTDSTVDLYGLRMKYVPAITSSMKANLRAIKLRGDAMGRDEGVLGQWGDSITHSQAYLGSMASWGMISTPPSNGHNYETILLWMGASEIGDNNPLHNFKGGNFGNNSGWRIGNGLAAIDDAIAGANPSWSLTMFGTNDITSWNAEAFETNLKRFIQINIVEGIVPVLSTIPPRTNYDELVVEANTVIRSVAQEMNIPLVDLHGLFMELHPNDWSSVLLGDGVHPSHSYGSGDLSDASLRNDGYNIRSVLTLDMAEKLKRIVFDNGPADGVQAPIRVVSSTTHPFKTLTTGLNAVFQINHDSGPVPGSYSWLLDQNPNTTPDTIPEGSAATVNVSVPADGTWYFHVRGSSAGIWGPAAHYCIDASEFPKTVIQRTNENPTAVRDTYISQLWGGDDNFGGASGLNIYNDDAIKRTRGLFRFDLTGVNKTSIVSVKLKLWTCTPVTADFDYEIYAITGAWTEGNGTWNNGDHSGIVWNDGLTFSNAPIETGTMAIGQDCLEVDVTGQVLAWLNGAQNHGFMLQHLELWKALELVSSENGMQEMRPSLTIEYNTPAGQWNYAPVLGTIGAKTVNEGVNLSITASATDRDSGDTLTYSISPVSPAALPTGISFNTATRVFSWTPGDEQSGTYTIRFTVNDGKQSDTEDVVITVRNMSSTPPQGRNVRVTTVAELRSAISYAQDGDTIVIADGEYKNGNPLILNNVDNIAIRSESNDPAKVILRGRTNFTGTGSYDELDDILRIGECNNVHVSGLTLTQAHGYGIKLELDEDSNPNAITIENCRFIDIGTRHIKGTRDSNSTTKRITGGAIRNCYFENAVTPPATGGWHFGGNYTSAIDLMSLDGWVIEDNEFRNIQGYSGEGRSAIMIWWFSENLTIQRNRIYNCDRGITLGLSGSELGGGRHVTDATVRNNFILPGSKTGHVSDAGIECSDVDDVKLYNNTIWRLNNDSNGRGIRFIQNIANTQMVNNLVYGRLVFDNNLTITRNEHNLSGNLASGYVVNASTGDLHLTAAATGAINQGVQLATVTEDIDRNTRGTTPDIGADEFNAFVTPTPTPPGGNTTPPPSGGNTTPPPSGDDTTPPPSGGNTTPPLPVGNTPTPSPGVTPPATITPTPSDVIIVQKPIISSGTAKATVTTDHLTQALNQSVPGVGGVKTIILENPKIKDTDTYRQEIPADVFRKGMAKERYVLQTPIASITIPGNMFPAGLTDKKQNMGISVTYADKSLLKKALAEKIGNRPVIQITAYADGKQIEWKNKNAPVTIALDYTPTEKELKNPDHIVVWYIDGKGNVVAVPNGRYDPVTKKVTFTVTHFSYYAVAYVEKTYSDIASAYAKTEIEVLGSKGFYEWLKYDSFNPNRNITRGEFLYLLVTALNLQGTAEDNFSDVKPTNFYYEAAGIAKKYGISNGIGNNNLGGELSITRQDMSTLVVRALKAVNKEYAAGNSSDLNQFNDAGEISPYAKDSLAMLVRAGVLLGYNKTLDPKGSFTMQQATLVILRVYRKL